MSWSLNAAGHFPDPDAEREFATSLGTLLEGAGGSVSNVSFAGSSFAGDPRILVRSNETSPADPPQDGGS
jgi:hypothetical protein